MISGWNEAGRWLDLSVHRFKFRLDQTRRLGPRPRSQPASSSRKPIADRIIISPHLSGGGREATQLCTRLDACKDPFHNARGDRTPGESRLANMCFFSEPFVVFDSHVSF